MSLYELLILLGMFGVTFSVRYLLIGFSSRITLPWGLHRALGFVPPAVLTAIIVPAVLMPDAAGFSFDLANAYLPAALAAVLIQVFSRRLILTILGGMLVFFLWGLFF